MVRLFGSYSSFFILHHNINLIKISISRYDDFQFILCSLRFKTHQKNTLSFTILVLYMNTINCYWWWQVTIYVIGWSVEQLNSWRAENGIYYVFFWTIEYFIILLLLLSLKLEFWLNSPCPMTIFFILAEI